MMSFFFEVCIFLGTSVSGSMIIAKSNGDNESPWKIPFLMSTCPISVPPDVTAFQLIMLLLINPVMFPTPAF